MRAAAHKWTKEQKEFLKVHYPENSRNDLLHLFNETFDLNIKMSQMTGCLKNNGITSGRTGHFKPGNVPMNKGTRGVYNVGGNKTSFKKGNKPKNYKPVGYERLCRNSGYMIVKVQDHGQWHENWKMKHRIIWEEAYGEVPEDSCLIFLDQNKENLTLENLALISNAQRARMNQFNLLSENPEFTKVGITLSQIYTKIGERNKK